MDGWMDWWHFNTFASDCVNIVELFNYVQQFLGSTHNGTYTGFEVHARFGT